MKVYKSIFFCGISLWFIIGCAKKQLPEVSKPSERINISTEQIVKQDRDYLLKELREKNPFRLDRAISPLAIENRRDTNVLKGIIWDIQKPFAIIGDVVAIQGDYIDNKKVIKIDKNSVTLDNHGKIETLILEEEVEVVAE